MMDNASLERCRHHARIVRGAVQTRASSTLPNLDAEQIYFLRVAITETISDLRAALDMLEVARDRPRSTQHDG